MQFFARVFQKPRDIGARLLNAAISTHWWVVKSLIRQSPHIRRKYPVLGVRYTDHVCLILHSRCYTLLHMDNFFSLFFREDYRDVLMDFEREKIGIGAQIKSNQSRCWQMGLIIMIIKWTIYLTANETTIILRIEFWTKKIISIEN